MSTDLKFCNLPEETKKNLSLVQTKYSDPNYNENGAPIPNWRPAVVMKCIEGDERGMLQAASPSLQFEIIRIAHEDPSSQVRLQAAQFILAQQGKGAVQKVEQTVNVEQMPTEQLEAYVFSKLNRLAELSGLDVDKVIKSLRVKNPALLKEPIKVESSEVVEKEVESENLETSI